MKPSLTKAVIVRLVILGCLSVVLSLCLAIAPVLADVTLRSAPIVYKDALPALQQSGVPLRLPTAVIYPDAHGAYGATLEYADASSGYSLTVGTRYPCHGTACTEAYVEATPVANLPPVEQMFAPTPVNPEADNPLEPTRSTESAGWVTLSNGQPAYFEPWISYVSPGFAHLTWDEGSWRYSIAVKFGFKDALVQMAESAVASTTGRS